MEDVWRCREQKRKERRDKMGHSISQLVTPMFDNTCSRSPSKAGETMAFETNFNCTLQISFNCFSQSRFNSITQLLPLSGRLSESSRYRST